MATHRGVPRWQQPPDGVRDWLPSELEGLRALEARFRSLFGAWGYREVATPSLELRNLLEAACWAS
jgi:ATP phosphoribosyltransferase regulatory subunit